MRQAEAFAVLGLEPGCDRDQMTRRYRDLVKRYHPDVAGPTADVRELSRILDAYETLRRLTPRVVVASERISRTQRPTAAPANREEKTARAQLDVRTLGKLATRAPHAATRCSALRQLTAGGTRAAAVYVRQALYDTDETVAREAVRALVRLKNCTTGTATIELFNTLRLSQRVVLLEELRAQPWQPWHRAIATTAYYEGTGALRRAATLLLQRETTSDGNSDDRS